MEGGFCPCPKELNKMGNGDNKGKGPDKSKDSDDDKQAVVTTTGAGPPSDQAPPSSANKVISLLDTNKGADLLGGENDPLHSKGTSNIVAQ